MGMTALGRATCRPVPGRKGAKAGDALFVTGTLGDAAAGYDLCREGDEGSAALRDAFNRPQPQLAAGRALAPLVHAMMDISDGLLIDARRMALASGLQVSIDLDALPLSHAYSALRGDSVESRLAAASWGDDYQLLFAAPSFDLPVRAACIGYFNTGDVLTLRFADEPVPLPPSLGFEHR